MATANQPVKEVIVVKKREGFPWNFFRFIRGIIFFVGLMVIASFILIGVALSKLPSLGSFEPASLPDKIVLTYTFKSGLEEVVSGPTLTNPMLRSSATLNDVVKTLNAAAKDERVKAFVAKIEDIKFNVAQVQELRSAVANFRKAGKVAEVYADSYGTMSSGMADYYFATGFDKVWMQPIGVVSITGMAAEVPFFRGFLDKVGVTPQFGHKGTYKSAVESITLTDMSAPAREAMESLINDLSGQMIQGIADSRHLTVSEVKADVDNAPYDDEAALKLKLVDQLGYYDEVLADAKQKSGVTTEKTVSLDRYEDDIEPDNSGMGSFKDMIQKAKEQAERDAGKTVAKQPGKKKIALIIAAGEIAQFGGTSADNHVGFGESGIKAETVVHAFKEVQEDDDVAAVVFRIDSPGGSPEASETIRRAIMQTRAGGKPVIISMGGYAASGGYWVATGGDKIVAQPGTITGSIGVFGGKMVVLELLNKLGVNWVTISNGAHAQMWSSGKLFTDEEMAKFEGTLDMIYKAFIARVSQARGLTPEQVEAVAEGRVWSGQQALDRKLVDYLGGLDRAVEVAKDVAKLDAKADIPLVQYPAKKSPWEMIADLAKGESTFQPRITINARDIITSLQDAAKAEGAALKAPDIQIH